MNALLSRERGTGAWLGRPFSDLWSAGMEITRTERGFVVEIPAAGFAPDQIEVTLEDGLLTVAGKSEKRSFTRTLSVPEEIDAENIEAKVEHGLLTLTLALLPKAQPKKIAVRG